MQLTPAVALQAIQLHSTAQPLYAADIVKLLNGASVTFAQLLYCTRVQLAAAHKDTLIQKVTSANVMLAATLHAHTQLYARAVRKSAAQYTENSAADVQKFQAQATYFQHTPQCYSVVQHKQHYEKLYLYALFNRASSVYVHDGRVVSKQHVAQYCTPSEKAELLKQSSEVYNVKHNIVHSVHVRTIALDNILSIRARKRLLSV